MSEIQPDSEKIDIDTSTLIKSDQGTNEGDGLLKASGITGSMTLLIQTSMAAGRR